MFKHFGLYFSEKYVQQAQKHREREPFKSAWAVLNNHPQTGALAALHSNAFRYRFNADQAAGGLVVTLLSQMPLPDEATLVDTLAATMTLIQAFELTRDQPAWSAGEQGQWLDGLFERVNALNARLDTAAYIEQVWLGALNLTAGIALEREDVFQAGVEIYQQVVREAIRPVGYIPQAVGEIPQEGDGQGLYRQLMVVKALVLMAEAASQVGVDLWSYHWRGVSVLTAATYLIYYYYYPDQWQWDAGLRAEDVQPLFRQHGGFLEMLNHHSPPKAIKQLLDDLRPIYDVHGGGLTTLTHGVARRGLFK